LAKTQLIYSVSYFNLGGFGALFGGISPQKPPRGDGTGVEQEDAVDSAFSKGSDKPVV